MDKYWQVVLTYLYRPRFLVAGAVYLATSWWWAPSVASDLRVMNSAEMACILACFIALHVRRQFVTPGRQVVPGFAAPHLIVAALASALVWIFVPWIEAKLTAMSAWNTIAVHSVAGLLFALVVIWPKAIALLAASPVLIVWAWSHEMQPQHSSFLRLIEGREPVWSVVLIVLAVLAQPLAAIVLLRLANQDGMANDDLSIETTRSERTISRWEGGMLGWRDASVERRLAGVGGWGWAVDRWRIPVTVSWHQLALVAVCAAINIGLAEYVGRGGATLVILVFSTVMLIMPFGPWNARRHALALELVRPVTRTQFCRGVASALALDVCLWTTLASFIGVVGLTVAMLRESAAFAPAVVLPYLAILWATAIWLYGVALATLRIRYWIPLIIISSITWTLATVQLYVLFHSRILHLPLSGWDPFGWSLVTAAVGALMAWFAYRRSLQADLA